MIYVVGLKNNYECESIFVNEIKYHDFSAEENFSAAIFTSKNAVIACMKNQINLENKKIFSIGLSTQKELEKYGLKVFYTGKTAHAKDFKYEILPYLKNEVCCYFRARNIISDLDSFLLKKQIKIKNIIAYENIRLKEPLNKDLRVFKKSIKDDDILIFLAPSGVRDYAYFFDFFPKNIISIGDSTAKELSSFGIKSISPSYPSLKNCLELAKNIK